MWQQLIQRLAGERPEPPDRRALAAAVLLLETARADFTHSEVELDAVRQALLEVLGLEASAVDELLQRAHLEVRDAASLHAYLAALNADMSAEDKRELLGALWRVAHADGHVHPQEEQLIRRLADLLHLPHHEFIRQKLAAGKR